MAAAVIENPILNSPFRKPTRHFRFDEQGITNDIVEARRVKYAGRCGGQVVQPPMDLVISEYDVVQPDLMYFGPAAAASLDPDDWVRIRPDIAIEVLSPSTDRGRKRALLARHGVPECWVVHLAARQIEISVLEGEQYRAPVIFRDGRCESLTQRGPVIDVEPLFAGLD